MVFHYQKEVIMPNVMLEKEKTTCPPWPYQTTERWKNAKKEGEKTRRPKPFYPDFMEDVFAGVL